MERKGGGHQNWKEKEVRWWKESDGKNGMNVKRKGGDGKKGMDWKEKKDRRDGECEGKVRNRGSLQAKSIAVFAARHRLPFPNLARRGLPWMILSAFGVDRPLTITAVAFRFQ